jgi:hypothetical protein
MMTIARFKEMGELFVAESNVMKKFIHGVADEDITAKLAKVLLSEYPVLVGIVPSMIGRGRNLDQLQHDLPMFFYCIESVGNHTEKEVDLRWDGLLAGIDEIELTMKKYESDPGWQEFLGLNPDTIHIDPEYGMWDCFGWSISFEIAN